MPKKLLPHLLCGAQAFEVLTHRRAVVTMQIHSVEVGENDLVLNDLLQSTRLLSLIQCAYNEWVSQEMLCNLSG